MWGRAREAAGPLKRCLAVTVRLIAGYSLEVFNTDLAAPGARPGVGVASADP